MTHFRDQRLSWKRRQKKIKNGLMGRTVLNHHLLLVIWPFNYVLTTVKAAGTGIVQDWVLTFSFGGERT